MEPMGRRSRYLQELRERAVRIVQEHRDEYPSEWAAITWIAGKLGVGIEALRLWLRRAQIDDCQRPGLTSQELERLEQLERENHELRRANEILTAASAFFAYMSTMGPAWWVGSLLRCPGSPVAFLGRAARQVPRTVRR